MLDYETVKRWKRDLMVNDPEFLTGRGRLESVEFHLAERIYLAGVADGVAVVAKLDEVVALLEQRGLYPNTLELVQEVRKLVSFDPSVPLPPPGYTAEELERDNPHNQWMFG
jgi:hypothetical protein